MAQKKLHTGGRGGRPQKTVKQDICLSVKCTADEAGIIRAQAKKANLTTSQYLRKLGVSCNVVIPVTTLPREVLVTVAALNHVGALLNQIARKRNSNDELNALERADLVLLQGDIKKILEALKTALK